MRLHRQLPRAVFGVGAILALASIIALAGMSAGQPAQALDAAAVKSKTISVGATPAGLAVSNDNKTLYVAVPSANAVKVYDTASLNLLATIPVGGTVGGKRILSPVTHKAIVVGATDLGSSPEHVYLSKDGSRLYVTKTGLPGPYSVAVVDTVSRKVVDAFELPGKPYGFAFSPDGASGYVATGACGVTVLDLAHGSGTPPFELSLSKSCFASSVAASADGNHIYLTDLFGRHIEDVNPRGGTSVLLGEFTTAANPSDVKMCGAGTPALSLCVGMTDGSLAIIDLRTGGTVNSVASDSNADANEFVIRENRVAYRVNPAKNEVDVFASADNLKALGEYSVGPQPKFVAVFDTDWEVVVYSSNAGNGTVTVLTDGDDGPAPSSGSSPTTTTTGGASSTSGGSSGGETSSISTDQPEAATPSATPTASALSVTPASSSTGVSPLIIAVIAILVLLFAAAVVLAVIVLRRPKAPTP